MSFYVKLYDINNNIWYCVEPSFGRIAFLHHKYYMNDLGVITRELDKRYIKYEVHTLLNTGEMSWF